MKPISQRQMNIKLLKDERIEDVKGFECRFMITDHGRLFSINGRCKGIKEIPAHIDGFGYRNTTLRMKPKYRQVRIHQLVAEHFVPPIEGKTNVNHLDENKLNNHYMNLQWCTRGENVAYSFKTGSTNFKGENHHNAKLTEKQVYEIHQMRKDGLIMRIIADKFGVNRRHVGDILSGGCWPHVYKSIRSGV